MFSEGEQEWGADHYAEDQGDVHELALAGCPSHKEGQEDAEGGNAEDDDFGVHLLNVGKLNDGSRDKINHEIQARIFSKKSFSHFLGFYLSENSLVTIKGSQA